MGTDAEPFGDLVVGEMFVTAHFEHPSALFREVLDRQFDHFQQVFRRYAPAGIDRQLCFTGFGLPNVLQVHFGALEPVEDRIARHPEQICTNRHHLPHQGAVVPYLQEDILCNVLRLGFIFQKPQRKVVNLRGVAYIERVEGVDIAPAKFVQQ